jgi:hypothetical protein
VPKRIAAAAAERTCPKIQVFFAQVNSGSGLLPADALSN